MFNSSKGLVLVAGKTYRIVERSSFHEVVRVLDDQVVGSFRHEPKLLLLRSAIGERALLEIARHAQLASRLSWRPRPRTRRSRWASFLEGGLDTWNRALATLVSLFLPWRPQPVPVLARSPGPPVARTGQ